MGVTDTVNNTMHYHLPPRRPLGCQGGLHLAEADVRPPRRKSGFDCRRRRSSLVALRYSYSINSSALSRIDVGTSRPSALAVVILSTVCNCTGRSAGFSLL